MTNNTFYSINYRSLTLSRIKGKFPYLILGMSISLILSSIIFNLMTKYNIISVKINRQIISQNKKISSNVQKYIVQENEDLWQIAEKIYGSGFNAYDIAQANKLTDPGLIYKGQALVLPLCSPKATTIGDISSGASTSQVTFTGNKYTVKQGDSLSKIALEVYGDLYAWPRIAQANKITNPEILEEGTVLVIPR